jgi:hypothetical protein
MLPERAAYRRFIVGGFKGSGPWGSGTHQVAEPILAVQWRGQKWGLIYPHPVPLME